MGFASAQPILRAFAIAELDRAIRAQRRREPGWGAFCRVG
jgi:hypothetical protein